MNRNSIFFNITLFFIVMIVVTHIIILTGYNITKQEQIDLQVAKYMKSIRRVMEKNMPLPPPPPPFRNKSGFMPPPPLSFPPTMMPPPPPLERVLNNKELNQYDLQLSVISYAELKEEGTVLKYEQEWELYEYEGFKYFYLKDRFMNILIKDTVESTDKTKYIIYLTILLNIVFFSFYFFLINKLRPLSILKKNIIKFSKGSLDIDTSCESKDEIGEVSNEFNKAIIQIKSLTDSRNLFLRNIMHELKTPITKGLLVSNMMEEGKYKNSLKKSFFRLEYLLNEFARIEEFTSKNTKLNKEEFRVIDILDHSLDILLCDIESIELEVIDNILVKVDFQLFSLAVKNLLDNAIKYGNGKPKVLIKDNTLYIKNQGKKLSKKIEAYDKPFNRRYENSSSGLGLGLYIVNHILKAHKLNLQYDYIGGENIIYIEFK